MNDAKDLSLILESRFPLVTIQTTEEARMLDVIEKSANLLGWASFSWSVVDGLRRTTRTDRITGTNNLVDALRHIDKTPQNGVYTLLDAHPYLEDPGNVRLIREIAQGYARCARTLVFVSPKLELPPELHHLTARFEIALPDATRIRQIIREEAQMWESRNRTKPKGDPEAIALVTQHLTGIPVEDARRLIRQGLDNDGSLNMSDVDRIVQFKRENLAAGGVLDVELDTGNFANVGGLANMKRWLNLRRAVFAGEAGTEGLPPPKGILLLGVQGSGKSLAAKAVAGAWKLPLLRLDFASLYNKFTGETERNLRESLKGAARMAPCVLWIDEIEKGLASDESGGDGGVSKRILGTLLTWMSERKEAVFLVATANDISRLPPELLRKGRFDEIFFVDLPDAATRSDIFSIHLKRRKLDPAAFDLLSLSRAADGFSGAEIEQAIVASMYEAHAHKVPLSTKHLIDEIARTRPLSVMMAEKIEELRAWAQERCVPAN
ncbi:MAG: AAA family ATPase [bacterium]|jgi:SpoVK/Ycf46/Vps4 family AAA+-type ATPase|nr:AAA family ATPase [Betaproteobacteria bacterium]